MLQHRLSPTLKERMKTDFPELAEYASERERLAESAERDLTRYFHARWAKDHVGETFSGIVVGVTNFGVFVALANAVEGLMHVSHLDDDYYIYLEDSLMLMGKHTRKRYRMGDRVEVKVLNANPTQRQIDLIPATMEMPDAEPEERPAVGKPPKKLRTPLEAGIDADLVTGRRTSAVAAARAGGAGTSGSSRGTARGSGSATGGAAKGAQAQGAAVTGTSAKGAAAMGAAAKGAPAKGGVAQGASAKSGPAQGKSAQGKSAQGKSAQGSSQGASGRGRGSQKGGTGAAAPSASKQGAQGGKQAGPAQQSSKQQAKQATSQPAKQQAPAAERAPKSEALKSEAPKGEAPKGAARPAQERVPARAPVSPPAKPKKRKVLVFGKS